MTEHFSFWGDSNFFLLFGRLGKNILLLGMSIAVLAGSAASGSFSGPTSVQEPVGSAPQDPSHPSGVANSPFTPIPTNQATGLGDHDLAFVQSSLSVVHGPNALAVAKALGIELSPRHEDFTDSVSDSIEELGNLDGDGIPGLVLKRAKPASQKVSKESRPDVLPLWELFLLAWDKTQWRASWLRNGFEPFELQNVSGFLPGSRQIAVVVYAGSAAIPYPAIYQVKDHAASLLWDGRADESQYQGYARGRVEFRSPAAGSVPQMIVSGRADPGLLHFPKGGKRGFDVQTTYAWDGKNYLPGKTEYVANEDFRMYQFISALHLRDFRSAYAMIAAGKFLKTDAPSLQIFRQRIENAWPEFLDDQIFEAQESTPGSANTFAFELSEEDKHYVYYPSFSADAIHLLMGLERREEKN